VRFGVLMSLPWIIAIAIEYVIFRRFFAADLVARLACLPAGFLARLEDVSAGRFFARRSVDFLGVGSAICEGMKILSVTKVNRIIWGRSLRSRSQTT